MNPEFSGSYVEAIKMSGRRAAGIEYWMAEICCAFGAAAGISRAVYFRPE